MSPLRITTVLGGWLFTCAVVCAGPLEESLTRDIKTAQAELEQTQTAISGKRAAMAKTLNDLERQVLALRQQTAVSQRAADERTLSLQQLQQRLNTWREQQAFQNNLLSRFLRQHAGDNLPNADVQRSAMQQAFILTQTAMRPPQWLNREVALNNGQMTQAATLAIGPLTWFWLADKNHGGFAILTEGFLREGLAFGGQAKSELQNLYKNGAGYLPTDPSLTGASKLAAKAEGPIEHISKGGLWAIPILFFALFALVIALAKAVQLWRLPKIQNLSSHQINRLITEPSASNKLVGTQGELVQIALNEPQSQTRDDQLFVALQEAKHTLERWLGAIAVTASVAPLLGLLGTVSGMIETFKMMTLFGAGDPQVVSGGISQALITTELGLVVAIPALILNALLSRRAKTYYNQLENFGLQLSAPSGHTVGQAKTEPPPPKPKPVKPTRTTAVDEALS